MSSSGKRQVGATIPPTPYDVAPDTFLVEIPGGLFAGNAFWLAVLNGLLWLPCDIEFWDNMASDADRQLAADTWCAHVQNFLGHVPPLALYGWCKNFDFSVNDGGFTPYNSTGTDRAVYVPGVGWGANVASDTPGMIQLQGPSTPISGHYDSVEFILSAAMTGPDHFVDSRCDSPAGFRNFVVDNSHTDIFVDMEGQGAYSIWLAVASDTSVGGSFYSGYLTSLIFRGPVEASPYGDSNCI